MCTSIYNKYPRYKDFSMNACCRGRCEHRTGVAEADKGTCGWSSRCKRPPGEHLMSGPFENHKQLKWFLLHSDCIHSWSNECSAKPRPTEWVQMTPTKIRSEHSVTCAFARNVQRYESFCLCAAVFSAFLICGQPPQRCYLPLGLWPLRPKRQIIQRRSARGV